MSNNESDDKPDAERHEPARLIRGDLNRYTLEHVLPEANRLVQEGQLREVMQQRDARAGYKPIVWLAEVSPGEWENTSSLPHGLPTIRMRGNPLGANGYRWQIAHHSLRMRVVRDWSSALRLARELDIRCIGDVDEMKVVRG